MCFCATRIHVFLCHTQTCLLVGRDTGVRVPQEDMSSCEARRHVFLRDKKIGLVEHEGACSVFRCSSLSVQVRSDMCSGSGSGSVNICSCLEAVQPEHLFMFGERCLGTALVTCAQSKAGARKATSACCWPPAYLDYQARTHARPHVPTPARPRARIAACIFVLVCV